LLTALKEQKLREDETLALEAQRKKEELRLKAIEKAQELLRREEREEYKGIQSGVILSEVITNQL